MVGRESFPACRRQGIADLRLEITTKAATPRRDTSFNIDVRFDGGLTPSQCSVFQLAAARWAEMVVSELPSVEVLGETVDDVLIVANGERIDGPNGVLGQAGPTHMRTRTLLPARGIMSFDADDLEDMGYQVNFDAADAFNIPTTVALTALHAAAHHVCGTIAPKLEILPE